ncbi:MAG: class I SAM-dependent rRNA methyltransferase [Acidobacteriota bacterium]|nr:class I SAM-dependent rRNA methyltransferase [Acidobacteriota bacterium]
MTAKKKMIDAPAAAARAVVNAHGLNRLREGHPWIFRGDVERVELAEAGGVVRVEDARGKVWGTALYSTQAPIALRMVAQNEVAAAQYPELLRYRIKQAIAYRQRVVQDADSFRVLFSEADITPGLIVDKYNDVLSVLAQTQAMNRPELRAVLLEELRAAYDPQTILERVDERMRELEGLPPAEEAVLYKKGKKAKTETVIHMNGLAFHYNGGAGQKTGAFLDQRENYKAAERHARGKALEICTYQGGFSLHMNRVCDAVTAVDISSEALAVAEQNRVLNQQKPVEWIEADAFELLRKYADENRRYETVVLDPPAFAKSKRTAEDALRGYKEINLRALKMIRNGGVLVTCSCSFHVSEQDFVAMLSAAALDARRNLHIIEKRMQAVDHPVLLNVPETHYLKCLVCSVF